MIGYSAKERLASISQAYRALETIQEQAGCGMKKGPQGIKKLKGFKKADMKRKAMKDAMFFEHLYDENIGSSNPAVKNSYNNLVTEAMLLAGKILQESDTAPRTVSAIIDNDDMVSEETMLNLYKRSFNMILENEFNKPNLKSELLFENVGNCQAAPIIAPGVKGMMIKCASNGILDNNDPEAVAKYIAAEQAVKNAVSNTLIPGRIFQQIQSYQNSLPQGYTDIFGDTMGSNMNQFQVVVSKIASIIAPFIFMKALNNVGANVPFNPAQVAGLSIDQTFSDSTDSSGNTLSDI